MKAKTRAAPLTPMERLRELARQVMAVPKTEIDKQERSYQRMRARKKSSTNASR